MSDSMIEVFQGLSTGLQRRLAVCPAAEADGSTGLLLCSNMAMKQELLIQAGLFCSVYNGTQDATDAAREGQQQ